MAGQIIVSETPETLADHVAADFLALIQSCSQSEERPPGWPSRVRVALAGGVTPKLFYARLAQEPYRSLVPWDQLYLYWGDERCVPPDHSESNFRMAQEALLSQVPIRPAQVYRMRGEAPPPDAAFDYERTLRNHFGPRDVWPVFDLVLLGMGADGHTASLLPGTAGLLEHPFPVGMERRRNVAYDGTTPPRWVVHNVIRSLQTVRITLTLPAINHAKNVWFLVTGAKKAAAFALAQAGPDANCPASLVLPEAGKLRWYVDKAVAGE